MRGRPLVWIFADGVGLAARGGGNPFSHGTTPGLERALGGPLTSESVGAADGRLLAPLDATLGVPGLPQSATGQTALFTGENAPAAMGRHVTALPGPRLREIIDRASVLTAARRLGARVTFANAYTDGYLDAVARGRRRPSVTTCCMLAAALPFRTLEHLARDEAVTWDICRDRLGERAGVALDAIPAESAGRHLGRLAREHDLVLYETFFTDLAGHGRPGFEPPEAVRRLDALIVGALAELPAEASLVVASDHGNLEDVSLSTHTRSPVPLLVLGPAAEGFAGCRSLLDVAPAVLAWLGAEG